MATLREQLIEEAEVPEENIGNYCSDLHVLFTQEAYDWLKANYDFPQNITIQYANVEGHDWYGKQFIEIPFAYEEAFTKRIAV